MTRPFGLKQEIKQRTDRKVEKDDQEKTNKDKFWQAVKFNLKYDPPIRISLLKYFQLQSGMNIDAANLKHLFWNV